MKENQNESASKRAQTPPSPITATQQVNPPHLNNAKPKPKFPLPGIIAVILIVLIFGSAAGFYVFKQQSNLATKPTPVPSSKIVKQLSKDTNLKTYTNRTYKYSLQFPTDVLMDFDDHCKENPAYGIISQDDKFFLITKRAGGPVYCQADFSYQAVFGISPSKIVKDNDAWYPNDPCFLKTTGEVLIGNTTIPTMTYEGNREKCPGVSVYSRKKMTFLDLSNNGSDFRIFYSTDSVPETYFSQILSTFRFTDNQIYRNDEVGFEFVVPEEYPYISKQDNYINFTNRKTGPGISFTIYTDDKKPYESPISCDLYLKDVENGKAQLGDICTRKETKTTLGGIEAIRYSHYSSGNGQTFEGVKTIKSPFIKINAMDDATVIEKVSSTFKFTN